MAPIVPGGFRPPPGQVGGTSAPLKTPRAPTTPKPTHTYTQNPSDHTSVASNGVGREVLTGQYQYKQAVARPTQATTQKTTNSDVDQFCKVVENRGQVRVASAFRLLENAASYSREDRVKLYNSMGKYMELSQKGQTLGNNPEIMKMFKEKYDALGKSLSAGRPPAMEKGPQSIEENMLNRITNAMSTAAKSSPAIAYKAYTDFLKNIAGANINLGKDGNVALGELRDTVRRNTITHMNEAAKLPLDKKMAFYEEHTKAMSDLKKNHPDEYKAFINSKNYSDALARLRYVDPRITADTKWGMQEFKRILKLRRETNKHELMPPELMVRLQNLMQQAALDPNISKKERQEFLQTIKSLESTTQPSDMRGKGQIRYNLANNEPWRAAYEALKSKT